MAVNPINIEKQIDDSIKNLPDYNYLLGRTLMQPFKPANSGSRALMNSVHTEQFMVQSHGEPPIISTGFEDEFGRKSTSYIQAKHNYIVTHKIYKFSHNPSHYYLIVMDEDTGVYDVIERVEFNHNTESYGYRWDNSRLDELKVGDHIPKGKTIKTSVGFDKEENKMNGTNLVTMYLSCAQNMEDSVILSESAAQKLGIDLIKSTSITINDNDILLNLYGDEDNYKAFPDVGEMVQGGIFCSIRRLENENVLYSLSQQRLRDIMISDRNILIDGIVADIDVYCNNPEALGDSTYNKQLWFYHQEKLNFANEINRIVGPIAMMGTNKMAHNLEVLYTTCRDIVGGMQYYKDKPFNNVIMDVTIIMLLPMEPGDKMCDRYGGKGVVSQIRPDELMPVLDNGTRVEVIKNQSTCINRENLGQLHEQSLTFIGMRIIDRFKSMIKANTYDQDEPYFEMVRIWHKFATLCDDNFGSKAGELLNVNLLDPWEARLFIHSILEDDAIMISLPPFTTKINIDTINEIYKAFPWITQYRVKVPMEDSNGNVRYVYAKRDLVIGKIYNYRLKQYAEEKFSVTSLSATNLKNLNTRSKANKMYETKYTKTPIMFGPMESGDLVHLGMQYVVMNLMLYSSSPQARRLFEQLLVGDPYNIDIKLDRESKNRNAEIIAALMKTMGLKLVFEKIPKKRKMMVGLVMAKTVPLKGFKYKTNIRDIIGHDDELEMQYQIALREKNTKPMVGRVMCKIVGEDKLDTNIQEENNDGTGSDITD